MASIILAFPVGSYIFRLFISSHDKSAKKSLTAADCKRVSKEVSISPVITVFAATMPLLFMYVVFFISQWKYYVSGFLGKLPQNVDYATYAREGFFQLLAVAAINLAVISAVQLFCKKGKKSGDLMIRLLTVIICVFTLILISTAISKLVLYINEYGLTPKRVHAFWGMMVLTLIFIAVILKQIVGNIKLIPIGLAISVYDKRISKVIRIPMYLLISVEAIIFTHMFFANNIIGFGAFHFLLVIILICAVNCLVIKKYASQYRKLNNKQ